MKLETTVVLVALGWLNIFSHLTLGQTSSDSLEAKSQKIIEKIDAGDREAILELGKLGDRSVLTYLRRLTAQQDKSLGSVAANAQMALAKLGDNTSYQQILKELHSPDPRQQDDAVRKLLYLGGKQAIRPLAELLKEERWRTLEIPNTSTNTPPPSLVQYLPPMSHVAIHTLSTLVKNPPTASDVEITENVLLKWRRWWEINQGNY